MLDKLWMQINIIPCPRLNVTGKAVGVRVLDCGIDNFGINESSDYAIRHVKFASPCLFFKIDPDDLLFFFGEALQPTSQFTRRKILLIRAPYSVNEMDQEIAGDNRPAEQEGYTEIRLTLYPKGDEPQWFKDTFGKKKNEGRSDSYWQKISRRIFHPINNFKQKAEVHKPNYEYLVPCSTALLPYSALWMHARVIDLYNGSAEL